MVKQKQKKKKGQKQELPENHQEKKRQVDKAPVPTVQAKAPAPGLVRPAAVVARRQGAVSGAAWHAR